MVITLLIFAVIYYYLNRRRKRQLQQARMEQDMVELQLKTIKNQMDPHFTFNAVNAIGSVIYNEDKETAYDYFARFAALIRASIQSSDKITKTLQEEIEFVSTYLELQKFRFPDKINYKIEVDENIDKTMLVPKMVLQTYVENSIKHGIMYKEKNGMIWIKARQQNGNIHLSIEDNGIGREAAKNKNTYGTGSGLKVLNQYYELFNKYNQQKIEFNIEDLKDHKNKPTGTKVNIIVPVDFRFGSRQG